MKLTVSIIIPTFDRLELLEKALVGLIKQDFDKKSYEIIVADNCSYNWANAVVNKMKAGKGVPRIVHLKIKEQGVNKARNNGVKIAKGEIIAFCDDDVFVDRLWLKNIVRAHEEYPSALVIGGRVEPIWEIEKPPWMPQRMEDYLAILDFGNEVIENPHWLVGANFSFKRKVFEIFGNFNESLGRKKNSFMYQDEIEFLDRVRSGGGGIFYFPGIKVKHFIAKERTTLRYLFKRMFWEGRSDAKVDRIKNKNLTKKAFLTAQESLFEIPRIFWRIVRNKKKEAVEVLMLQIFAFGYFYQTLFEKKNEYFSENKA